MKQTIQFFLCAAALTVLSASCENVSDTPPINQGYATSFRMPDPDILTPADRKFLEEQENEYNENAK